MKSWFKTHLFFLKTVEKLAFHCFWNKPAIGNDALKFCSLYVIIITGQKNWNYYNLLRANVMKWQTDKRGVNVMQTRFCRTIYTPDVNVMQSGLYHLASHLHHVFLKCASHLLGANRSKSNFSSSEFKSKQRLLFCNKTSRKIREHGKDKGKIQKCSLNTRVNCM